MSKGITGDIGPHEVLDSASEKLAPDREGSRRCMATSCWSLSSKCIENGHTIQAITRQDGASSTIKFASLISNANASKRRDDNHDFDVQAMHSNVVLVDACPYWDSVLAKFVAFCSRRTAFTKAPLRAA